ncbi:signal recognition particle-docking protein FtsY [Salibacterium salarium]|uniref:Signal recognition particle receptor FtsY n=1 Tax=Salibacterium salarium TaxID=284579 RepID=A0A428MZ38_9BACI|nr:signal recognition particle-docking protein FtsY [Salibacterium salarium]RSL31395.1 signal recognition particle-docking protein FtsY [Salibacterium salarium]
MGFFDKLKKKVTAQTDSVTEKFKEGLTKTRNSFVGQMNELFAQYRNVDEEFFEELEDILISGDAGVSTVMELIDELKHEAKLRNIKQSKELAPVISEKLAEKLDKTGEDTSLNIQQNDMTVILFVGVNGVGKTTTIGKMAHSFKQEGKKVVMAAGDTFRAGAIEQLDVWGERVGVDVVKQQAGSDPAAVMYDAIHSARSKKADVLLCDTAGRLQNKVNLMKELEKVKRVISREIPNAPHEVLLVLDATTGQNAMNQAKTFQEATDVSGIALTKLDGTAKGGIVLAIRNELDIPVKLVGLGEGVDDMQPFDAEHFVYGLFKELVEENTENENR